MNGFTREELFKLSWQRPILAQIELTNKCNQLCSFCYQKRTAEKTELSFEEWQLIISKLMKLGVNRLDFTGSENLMLPYFKDLIIWSKERKLKIRVNTNGTHNVSACLPYIDELIFSVHGLKDIHDKLVGYPGSFSLLETNLNRSLQSGAQTSINMTLVRSNYHQLLDVFSYFNSLYKIHKFAPVIPINSPNSTLDDDMLVLDVELMDDYFKKLRLIPIDKLTIKHGLQSIFINAPNHYKSSGFTLPNCAGGKYKLIVDSDGRVFPCNFFKEENFYCGNILTDDEPLIWHHGKGFTLFRELILEEKIPAKCKSCLKKARCFSGCRAWSSSYNKGGFEYTSDKRCKIGSAFIRS